ncbi:phage tail tape measure protein [Streptomyces sp. NBC_00124]|uniref:phage tail tape measure protein n=1 Tax=Streptomyces sp. NBC_00124 TaxID=2975662 RepID=UPI002254E9F5|nr:phage tail tape measure protein [Streptomyces sp. NBC_00124]MCX5362873.1 phage tail tape measure protein [Streptomyces sp. NBC_00124]
MALTVGELAATITVDDTEAEQGLNGFQQRLRQALSRITQRARTGGQEAGDALGEGLDEGATQGAEAAGNSITDQLNGLAMGAIGGALGAALMGGIAAAMEQEQITAKLGAQLGATPAEAKRYGEIAGDLYAHAITQDFQGAADAIKATMSSGLVPPDATNAQIESISTKVADLANTFEQDLGGTANAVSQMLRTGLASSADEAFDILTAGFQSSANKADDLVDTFSEYGTQFRKAGLDGATAVGLMNQAIQAGARDSDIAADAIKEFSIRAVDGSASTAAGFQALGLNADEMAKKFGAGGKSASEALDSTLDRLRNIEDPVKRSAAAVALFGTQSEDLGDALFAMDPSTAVQGLGEVGGAADRLGNTLHDNAATKLEQFKRALSQGFVEMLGGTVVPIIEKFGGFLAEYGPMLAPLAGMVLGIAAAMGIWTAAQAIFNAVMAANPIVLVVGAIIGLITVLVLAYQQSEAFRTIVQAVWSAVTSAISVAVSMIVTTIGWFGTLPTLIAGWFGAAKDWAIAKFTELTVWLQGLPGRASSALSAMGPNLQTAARNGFTSFRTAAAAKVSEFITYVRGIPGRISSAMGSLGTLLVDKGKDVVRGLYNGVRSMGGWLRSQLISFAKAMIPGPIAKALGIHSPSRVMRDQIGRWIPAGIVEGIEGEAPAVDATMRNLVTVPTSGQTTAANVAAQTGAVVAANSRQTASTSRVVLDVTGTDPHWKALIRRMVRVDGRGSVQLAFGS